MGQTEEREANLPVWYALQTFFQKELEVENYLKEKGYAPFVPKLYQERIEPDGQKRRILTPAVHNLVFLPKKTMERNKPRFSGNAPIRYGFSKNRIQTNIMRFRINR